MGKSTDPSNHQTKTQRLTLFAEYLARGMLTVCCLLHAYAHVLVLGGLMSIDGMPNLNRNVYFSFDLLVSLSSWMMTRRNTLMVAIHAMVHLSAVGHLLQILPTKLFNDVFEMGELDYGSKIPPHIVFYVWGTTQDICNHLLNAYHLNRDTHLVRLLGY